MALRCFRFNVIQMLSYFSSAIAILLVLLAQPRAAVGQDLLRRHADLIEFVKANINALPAADRMRVAADVAPYVASCSAPEERRIFLRSVELPPLNNLSGKLSRATANFGIQLARAGDFDLATDIAHATIGTSGPHEEHVELAALTFGPARAYELLSSIDEPRARDNAIAALAYAQATLGSTDEAVSTLGSISGKLARKWAEEDLAKYLAELGHLDAARGLIKSIGTGSVDEMAATQRVVTALIGMCRPADALLMTEHDPYLLHYPFRSAIAQQALESDNPELVGSIQRLYGSSPLVEAQVQSLLAQDNYTAAAMLLDSIPYHVSKGYALYALAEYAIDHEKWGDAEQWLSLLHLVRNEAKGGLMPSGADLIERLAILTAQRGDLDGAVRILQLISQEDWRVVLEHLVKVVSTAAGGDVAESRLLATGALSPLYSGLSLAEAAQTLANAGNGLGATTLANYAETVLKRERSGDRYMIRVIAANWTNGTRDRALDLLGRLPIKKGYMSRVAEDRVGRMVIVSDSPIALAHRVEWAAAILAQGPIVRR